MTTPYRTPGERDREFAEEFSGAAKSLALAVADLANAQAALLSARTEMARLHDQLERRERGDGYEP